MSPLWDFGSYKTLPSLSPWAIMASENELRGRLNAMSK
tara:strand:+ start:364 stop:477 length:114 start_codon:yes stop_codon:yes gene_type:complete